MRVVFYFPAYKYLQARHNLNEKIMHWRLQNEGRY